MESQVRAQLRSSSGRSSKTIKDHARIETVVDVAGVGRLVLNVDSRGGYSLRAYPEDEDAPERDLLAVGAMHAEGVVAIHLEGLATADGEQGAPRPQRSPEV